MSTTLLSPATGSAPVTSVKDLAGATKSDRNRAIDLYRALAMLAVSIGHYPEERSENKGSEPEAIEFGDFGGDGGITLLEL